MVCGARLMPSSAYSPPWQARSSDLRPQVRCVPAPEGPPQLPSSKVKSSPKSIDITMCRSKVPTRSSGEKREKDSGEQPAGTCQPPTHESPGPSAPVWRPTHMQSHAHARTTGRTPEANTHEHDTRRPASARSPPHQPQTHTHQTMHHRAEHAWAPTGSSMHTHDMGIGARLPDLSINPFVVHQN